MDEKEYSNVYAIPANYTDSGKLLGGMIETRNAIETVLLVAAVGYPELFVIPMPGHDPHRGHDADAAAAGGYLGDGRGWRLAVSIYRAYHPLLDAPEKTAFQEDRISL